MVGGSKGEKRNNLSLTITSHSFYSSPFSFSFRLLPEESVSLTLLEIVLVRSNRSSSSSSSSSPPSSPPPPSSSSSSSSFCSVVLSRPLVADGTFQGATRSDLFKGLIRGSREGRRGGVRNRGEANVRVA